MFTGALTAATVVLVTLAILRIKRNNAIYADMKANFREWLHQFDDPETGD